MSFRPLIWLLPALLAGCTTVDAPGATTDTPTPAATVPSSASPGEPSSASPGAPSGAAVDDPPGAAACARLADAIARSALMDADVINGITVASGTADAPVADAAQRLAAAYATAVAAKGAADEPDAVAAVSAAAADLAGICADSGLQTAG